MPTDFGFKMETKEVLITVLNIYHAYSIKWVREQLHYNWASPTRKPHDPIKYTHSHPRSPISDLS
jgi:hypothetical protein